MQYDYAEQAAVDIQQNFGNKSILDELFKGPLNTWIGPVESGYGWHLIFISKRSNAAEIPFASIKEDVKAKWVEATKAAQNKRIFDQLGEKYIIKRAYLESK